MPDYRFTIPKRTSYKAGFEKAAILVHGKPAKIKEVSDASLRNSLNIMTGEHNGPGRCVYLEGLDFYIGKPHLVYWWGFKKEHLNGDQAINYTRIRNL